MKQSTLFSMVGNASAHPKLPSKPNDTITNKENVEVKMDGDDEDDCVVVKDGEIDADNVSADSKLKLSTTKYSSETKFEMPEKKEVISYEDFISGSKTKNSDVSSKSKDGSVHSDAAAFNQTETVISQPCKTIESKGRSHSKGKSAHDHTTDLIVSDVKNIEESDKQSMSYKDFLGMFKPALSSGSIDDGQEKEVAEVDRDISEEDKESLVPTKKESVSCKPITSFFKPAAKVKPVADSKRTAESSSIIVIAEVHRVPSSESEGESSQKRLKRDSRQPHDVKNKKRPSSAEVKKALCDGDDIVLISSTVDSCSSQVGVKKRKITEKETGSRFSLQKKSSTTPSQGDLLDKAGGNKSMSAACAKSHLDSGQRKLSFGASGLTVAKENPNQETENVKIYTELSDSTKVTAETSGKMTKSEPKKPNSKRLKLKSSSKETRYEKGGNVDCEAGVKNNALDDRENCIAEVCLGESNGTVDTSAVQCLKSKQSCSTPTVASKSDNLHTGDESERLMNSARVKSPSEYGQSTLSFGASRLSITKDRTKKSIENESTGVAADPLVVDIVPAEENVGSETKKRSTKRLGLRASKDKKIVNDSKVDVKRAVLDSASNESIDCLEETCKGGFVGTTHTPTTTEGRQSKRLRLRTAKAAELEDDPVSEPPTPNRKIDEEDSAKIEVVDEGNSTPILRRSSRIRHHVESSAKKVEVIELDSDDCESEKKSVRKAQGGKDKLKKSAKLAEQSREHKDESHSSKVPRKLAPIFTRLLQPQAEIVKPLPPPTPEELAKLQARRDFLMSGIPDELKRARAALDLHMLPEYPPFPCLSHIRQIDEIDNGDDETVKRKGLLLRVSDLTENAFCGADDFRLKWDNLGWTRLVSKQSAVRRKLIFQDFSRHLSLNQRQIEVLIQESQERDRTFPFRETLDSLTAASDASNSNVKETSLSAIEDDVIVVDDTTPRSNNADVVNAKSSMSTNGALWTDEHPMGSKHFVGNSKSLKQLSEWLGQWQDELRREAKKALKGGKASKDMRKKVHDWSDDSDFTDSSEEDCRLCNTMLVTGPHGVGKTSIVYCLAKEMGFKVFEVNPTSLRSGKQLQSQLEEATQSHRVSHKSTPSSGQFETPPAGTVTPKPVQEPMKSTAKPPACKAFNAFFKPTAKSSKNVEGKEKSEVIVEDKKRGKKKKEVEAQPLKSEKRKSKKRKDEGNVKEDEPEKGATGCDTFSNPLNITSASIILFDEADVVLEEDKGFLSAVQHFMSSTKIPIIITATHPSIHSQLSPRHERIILRRPPVKTLSSFLRTVCLAKGVRVGHKSLTHLVTSSKQDIRQSLLRLQFWCESGGGRNPVQSNYVLRFNMSKTPVTTNTNIGTVMTADVACGDSAPNSDCSNDSDFMSLRPARKRQRRMQVFDDEDSNSNISSVGSTALATEPEVEAKCDHSTENAGSGDVDASDDRVTLPLVHTGCVSSLGGHASDGSIESAITNLIKEPVLDLNEAVVKIVHFQSYLPSTLLYNTTFHCCSVNKSNPLPVRLEVKVSEKSEELPKKKRKRIMVGDWLDSDGSEDDCNKNKEDEKNDCVAENEKTPSLDEVECTNNDLKTSVETECLKSVIKLESRVDDLDVKDSQQLNSSRKSVSSLTSSLLQAMSRFYENNSSVQCLYSTTGLFKRESDEACLLPGVSDEEILKVDTEFDSNRVLSQEIYGCVNVLSSRTMVKEAGVCLDKKRANMKDDVDVTVDSTSEEQWEDANSLPIGTQLPDIWMSEKDVDINQEAATKNVATWVGYGGTGSMSHLHLDYMPALRQMCRFEHQRQSTNAKRRFNHYFDYIGLNLKESTRVSLTCTYSVSR